MEMRAVSHGRTTGHIADLILYNSTDKPQEISVESFYIPTTNPYQGFVVPSPTPAPLTVAAGETATIPIHGYCTDIRREPPPAGMEMIHPSRWITSEDVAPITPGWQPAAGSGFTPTDRTDNPIVVTFPGTDEVFPYFIDINHQPEQSAPLILEGYRLIEQAYDRLTARGQINTPFASNPDRQREAVVQQSFWIFTSVLKGEEYKEDEFVERMEAQFEENAGMKVEEAPEAVRENFEQGMGDFWDSFQLVGAEAKVIAHPETEKTPPPEESDDPGCNGDVRMQLDPEHDLNMTIDEEWGDAEERAEIEARIRAFFERDLQINAEEAFSEYDISYNPTSVTAFWKSFTVGGFASAYAKAQLHQGDRSEWVWGTDELRAEAQGEGDFTMEYRPDEGCSAFVVGVSLARVRANSSAFDAVAGNELGENAEDQLQFLRGTKFFGKLAMEYLIARARRRTSQSFARYARDAVRNEIEGQIEETVMSEARELAEEHLDQLLEDLGLEDLDVPDLELPSFELPDLETLLEETFGIEITTLDEWLDEGLEAFFNNFFVSNTYATANGALVVRIGDNGGTARAHTRALYARQELETSDQAMTGTGEDCRETLVSDVQPNALTIHTFGISRMEARAQSSYGFGNGHADATLESMQLQVLVGVCICPDGKIRFEIATNLAYYAKEHPPGLREAAAPFETNLQKLLQGKIDRGEFSAATDSNTWKNTVEAYVRQWGAEHPFIWNNCE